MDSMTKQQRVSDNSARWTLTVAEAGKLLGISRNSAYLAAKSGQLPVVRIGGRLLVSRARLAALLDAPPEERDAVEGEAI